MTEHPGDPRDPILSAVALQGEAVLVCKGSWSPVFGGRNGRARAHPVSGAELFTTAGRLPYSDRPEALKGVLAARILPLELTKEIP